MADHPALPFRLLRASLRAASRASASMVERMLREGVAPGPARMPNGRGLPRGPLRVRFDGREVPATAGATLLEAARLADVDLRSYCGGNCSCGTCRVEVVAGAEHLSRAEPMEQLVLGMAVDGRVDRLACQAQVWGPVEVRIPPGF